MYEFIFIFKLSWYVLWRIPLPFHPTIIQRQWKKWNWVVLYTIYLWFRIHWGMQTLRRHAEQKFIIILYLHSKYWNVKTNRWHGEILDSIFPLPHCISHHLSEISTMEKRNFEWKIHSLNWLFETWDRKISYHLLKMFINWPTPALRSSITLNTSMTPSKSSFEHHENNWWGKWIDSPINGS